MWVPAEARMGDGFLGAGVTDSGELSYMGAGSPVQVLWRNNSLKTQPHFFYFHTTQPLKHINLSVKLLRLT